MSKTSSVVTGSATVAAAAIAPLVEWLANSLWKVAMPPQVVLIVAAALVTFGHFTINIINAELEIKRAAVTARAAKEGGFAHIGVLLGLATLALALSGCSLMSPTIDKVEQGMMQTIVQSSERTICRDLPVGAWMAYYGTNAERAKGWQALCFNPVKAPLNDSTVAAILKVYPGFQQAADAGTELPVVQPAVVVPSVQPAAVADPAPPVAPAAPAKPKRIARAAPVKPVPLPLPAPVAPLPAVAAAAAPVAQAAPVQTSLLSTPVVRP